MKTSNRLYIIMAIGLFMIFLIGCTPITPEEKDVKSNTGIEKDISPPKAAENPEQPKELIEKRGQQTDINDFKEFLRKTSAIEEFSYILKDTEMKEEREFFIKGRYLKIKLPTLKKGESGEEFDEVLIDKVSKNAFAHCGPDNCERDRELERVEYEDYYRPNPYETMTRMRNAELIDKEMIGNDYTKVFSITYDGKDAKVWIQEYWGYPIKIEIGERIIEYQDMIIDNTRSGLIDTPYNFTVKGEEGTWWTWEHYLGIMPSQLGEPASDFNLPLQVKA